MAYDFSPDVTQMIQSRMSSGRYSSEDELLREAMRALSNEEAEYEEIRDALDDLEAGDPGIPLNEAIEIVRRRHGLPTSQ